MQSVRSMFHLTTMLLVLFPALAMAAKPVPVPVSDEEPFQWAQSNIEFDPTQGGVSVSFTVPAGKRLVIEHVSGNVLLDIGNAVVFSVSTTVNDTYADHQFVLTPLGPAGGFAKSHTTSESVRLYADPLTNVILYAGRTDGGRGAMHVSISGYLIDVN